MIVDGNVELWRGTQRSAFFLEYKAGAREEYKLVGQHGK
jgi:hypothetical protein